MFKKLLVSTLAILTIFSIATSAKAADVYGTIDVTGGQYPNIEFYPRTLHVNQGDTLHLTVRNTRLGYTRIFMPAFNLDQEIPKSAVAKLDLCIANPISKVMWFQISSLSGEKVPGYIITTNYQVPIVNVAPKVFDTSPLNKIINYNKDFCYPEKKEPSYGCPAGKKCPPVRGYW